MEHSQTFFAKLVVGSSQYFLRRVCVKLNEEEVDFSQAMKNDTKLRNRQIILTMSELWILIKLKLPNQNDK